MRKLPLIAAILGMSATALAGFKTFSAIYVDAGAGLAYGSMGYVRASADSVQYIGCTASGYPTYVSMSCSARDAAGAFVFCTSTNPNLVTAVSALNSDSSILFTWEPATGQCSVVRATTSSYYQPKAP